MKKIVGGLCRKALVLLLATGITLGTSPAVRAAGSGEIMVFVDGEYLSTDVTPYTKGGYTMLPMRAVYESLGAEVAYDKNNKQITVYTADRTIVLFVDKNVAYVNGSAVPLSAAPEIKNGRTMVGLRDGATMIGADVTWDPVYKTANVWTEGSSHADLSYEDDSYEEDYYEEDYYEEDYYEEDYYEEDYYEEDYYEEDYYEEDYYEEDWYEEDYYEDDWYEDDYYEDDRYEDEYYEEEIYEEHDFDEIGEGTWWDIESQRAHMTLEKTGKNSAEFTIGWSSSAYEAGIWVFDCIWDAEKNIFSYKNGGKGISYRYEGEPPRDEVVYEDGHGYFYFEDDLLYWVDEKEGYNPHCIFEYSTYQAAEYEEDNYDEEDDWYEETDYVDPCEYGHTKGTFLFYEKVHPHKNYYECRECGEEFTDGSTSTMTSCTTCNPVKQGYWSNWSDWSTTRVSSSPTRKVESKTVEKTSARTEYRYGRYVSGSHDCWCSAYLYKLGYGSGSLDYSDWSTVQYSDNGKDWTCGYCNSNHYNVDHSGSDGRDWWNEYKVNGKSYYWEESRYVAPVYETQYRYSDWIE